MLLNPWRMVKILQQQIEHNSLYISKLREQAHKHYVSELVMQRELSYAHAALRRKNKQLKYLKATVEIHKEYVKGRQPIKDQPRPSTIHSASAP